MFWTLAYDTEYAMVDRDDDMRLNIKTSALLFGVFDVAVVLLCQALFILIMAGVGASLMLGLWYFAGLALALLSVVRQYQLIKTRERERCFKAFMHNNWMGAAVFGGLALDYLFRVPIFK